MTELTVMNLFTVLRCLIVGGFFFILPLITRKGLLFGSYIGEAAAGEEPALRLRRTWFQATTALTSVAIVIGLAIGLQGRPLFGTFVCVTFLFVTGPLLYLRWHLAARKLAPSSAARQGEIAVASLEADQPTGEGFAKLALGVSLVVGLAAVVHAAVHYSALPAEVPTLFGFSGDTEALSPKSFGSVMVPSLLSLVLAPSFALFGLFASRAKRSLRGGSGGESAAAQTAFRRAFSQLFSGTALCTCAFLSFLSVQFIRLQLKLVSSWGLGLLVVSLGILVFIIPSLLRLLIKYGQGGALLEQGSEQAPLTDGIADDGRWVLGVLYFNREDPSLMVEKRFGLGYTLNFGNAKALLFVLTVPLLSLALVAIAIAAATT